MQAIDGLRSTAESLRNKQSLKKQQERRMRRASMQAQEVLGAPLESDHINHHVMMRRIRRLETQLQATTVLTDEGMGRRLQRTLANTALVRREIPLIKMNNAATFEKIDGALQTMDALHLRLQLCLEKVNGRLARFPREDDGSDGADEFAEPVSLSRQESLVQPPLQHVCSFRGGGLLVAPEGSLLSHPTHGIGKLVLIDQFDHRDKPFEVQFDNGELHHYSMRSAREKLTVAMEEKVSNFSGPLAEASAKLTRMNASLDRFTNESSTRSEKAVRVSIACRMPDSARRIPYAGGTWVAFVRSVRAYSEAPTRARRDRASYGHT